MRAEPIVRASGEGESLSDEAEYLLKAALPPLSLLESAYPRGEAVRPHVHERHSDAFYVLKGELEFRVADETVHLPAGSFVVAPPGVVHGFSVVSADGARWLNLHAPDGGFAESRRARRDGREPREPLDVSPPPADGRRPATEAIVRLPGEGERLTQRNRVATVKAELPELGVLEFELDGHFTGPDLHTHDDHTDSFYVLEGEIEFTVEGTTFTGGPGMFVAAPIGVEHRFGKPGPTRARLLNVHAPGAGFVDRLRHASGATIR
ncbi:MAG: cupin domain-containing protein [Thermoleophilia bacterium]|nr:cupin domain-containing protein [Thermoleophilia bacterium]